MREIAHFISKSPINDEFKGRFLVVEKETNSIWHYVHSGRVSLLEHCRHYSDYKDSIVLLKVRRCL